VLTHPHPSMHSSIFLIRPVFQIVLSVPLNFVYS
jgi:hypothetical protein